MLDAYKIFYTVVKSGNMSAAAKQLYITQPAVSMAVKQLEKQLGQPLLVRSSKGIKPTAEGEMLFEHLEQALHLIASAEDKFKAMADMRLGEVRIGASDTLLSHYLIGYIERFARMYPSVAIKATNRTTLETIKGLRLGAVDIGFVHLPLENDDNLLEITPCLKIQDCLIGGKKYSHLATEGLTVQAMQNYPLMLLEKESNSRQYINAYAKSHGLTLNPAIELGSSHLLAQFAQINLGLTFVIKEFASDYIDGVNLFEIPLSPAIAPRHVGMVKLKGVGLNQAARQFVRLVEG